MAAVVGGITHNFGAIEGDFPIFNAKKYVGILLKHSDTVRCPYQADINSVKNFKTEQTII